MQRDKPLDESRDLD